MPDMEHPEAVAVSPKCRHGRFKFASPQIDQTDADPEVYKYRPNIVCADCELPMTLWHVLSDGSIAFSAKPPRTVQQRKAERAAQPKRAPTPKKPETPKPPPLEPGPGMELKLIFNGLGVPNCQACDELARDMNAAGIDWCEENVDAIAEKILPRAQEWLTRPEAGWTDRFKARAPGFAKLHVIKRYVQLANQNWRAKVALAENTEE